MKKIFFIATAFVFSLGAFAQTKVDETVKMNTEKHDFGKIKQGVPITYYFEIKNISDKPIVVENSWASCGCTTPEKIVDPIMPGGVAKLKVEYNYIKFAGIEQTKTLQITGEVLSAEAYEIYVKEKGAKTPAPKKG